MSCVLVNKQVSCWLISPLLIPVSITLGSSLCLRNWVAWLSLSLLAKHLQRQHYTRGNCGSCSGTIPWGQKSTTKLSCAWFPFLQWPWYPSSDGSKKPLSQRTRTTWNSCNLHNTFTLLTFPLLHLHLESSCTHWHLHSVLWIRSLAFLKMIANASGFGMETKSYDSLKTWISENCEEFRHMQTVRHATFVGTWWLLSSLDCTHKICATRNENWYFYQKSLWSIVESQDLLDFCAEFYWVCMCFRESNPQSREPCPSVHCCRSVQRYPSKLVEVGSVCGLGLDLVGIIPSVWRLAVGLQRVHPHFVEVLKRSRHAGTDALLSLLYVPLGTTSFFFLHGPSTQQMHYDFICRSDRNDTLHQVPQNKKLVPLGCFWKDSINKTLLVFSLAVLRKS